jgi:hypothetical protein
MRLGVGLDVIVLPLASVLGNAARHAHGWALAEKHAATLEDALSRSAVAQTGTIALMDFAGIESMSASYVKRILVWFLIAGERHAVGARPAPEGPPAMNVYPVIMNAAADVHEEIAIVLEHANKTCFEAVEFDGRAITRARLVGRIEKSLTQTLLRVVDAKEASAPAFHDRFPGEQIGVTAWNNRLNELYARRLVWRDKRVRQFVFRPFVEEIADG